MHSLYFTEELRKDFVGKSRATNLPVKFPIYPSSNEKSRRRSEAEAPFKVQERALHKLHTNARITKDAIACLSNKIRTRRYIKVER